MLRLCELGDAPGMKALAAAKDHPVSPVARPLSYKHSIEQSAANLAPLPFLWHQPNAPASGAP